MKSSTLFLSLSLLANAALIGVLVLRAPAGSTGRDATATARTTTAAPAAGSTGAKTGNASANAATVDTSSAPKLWDRIRADDYKTLVAHLRAAGFPPLVVRRVITALVTEKYDARRLDIEKDYLSSPVWAQNRGPYMDPKIGPQLRALQKEQTEEVKNALGSNIAGMFADTDEEKAMLKYSIGDIPADKLDQLYAVAMDYGEKRMKIYASLNTGGTMLPADREALAAIEKGMRDDLAKFLTPAEVADFNLHASQASYQLRSTLAAFQPTEDEFRTLLPLYQAYQEQFPAGTNNLPPEQDAQRKAAQEAMIAQVKAQLGPDRATDFQQAIDPANAQINRLVARLDLPISAATQVQAVQKDVQDRASAIRTDTSLSKTDQQTQLNALADEASAKISTALGGTNGLEAYKMNGGQWILGLRPRPPAAPKG